MSLTSHVAAQIRELRTSYNHGEGLSQETLANSLGIAANTVSRWETGVYVPSLHDVEKLARFFGVSMMVFIPPEETEEDDDDLKSLLRTARQLDHTDIEELRKYAEFRKARSMYKGKKRPKAGRRSKKR